MTRQWLRVSGVPSQRWVLMQVDFHRVERGRPSRVPFARAGGGVGRGTMNAPVEILGSRKSKDFEALSTSKKLPPGTYQLRFYVDTRSKLQRNPFYTFGSSDISGVMQITVDDWPEDSSPTRGRSRVPVRNCFIWESARRRRSTVTRWIG